MYTISHICHIYAELNNILSASLFEKTTSCPGELTKDKQIQWQNRKTLYKSVYQLLSTLVYIYTYVLSHSHKEQCVNYLVWALKQFLVDHQCHLNCRFTFTLALSLSIPFSIRRFIVSLGIALNYSVSF